MPPLKTNSIKDTAVAFLQLAAAGNAKEGSKYLGPNFRHHNIYFKGDANSLITAMDENAAKFPNKKLEIKRALQEGDLVAVHSHVRIQPTDAGAALVHIFRFESDRIVELWDIGQAIPDNSPNEYGMF